MPGRPYDDFQRGGDVDSVSVSGRWQLRDEELTVTCPAASASLAISAATPDTFDAESHGADQVSFRRCSAAETRLQAGPEPIELPEPEPINGGAAPEQPLP